MRNSGSQLGGLNIGTRSSAAVLDFEKQLFQHMFGIGIIYNVKKKQMTDFQCKNQGPVIPRFHILPLVPGCSF